MIKDDFGYFIRKLEGNYFNYLVSIFDYRSKQLIRQEGFETLDEALSYIKEEYEPNN